MKTKNIEFRKTKMHKFLENKDKEKKPVPYIFIMSLAVMCFVLFFVGIGVVGASVTCDGTRIVISNGTENLTTINQALNNPNLLEQLSAKEWLLKKPIQIESSGNLKITDTDCDWLKLQSLNDGNPAYIKNFGILDMQNTKVTSWNSNTNTVAPKTDSTRPYIHSQGKLLADSCDLSSLGYDIPHYAADWYGIHLKGDGSGSIIKNSTITNNFYGLAIDESNVQVIDCEIYHSKEYGVYLAPYIHPISNIYFEGVAIHDNQLENFECQLIEDTGSVINSIFVDCESYNCKGNCFDFRSVRNSLIKNCKAHDSGFYGDWHSCFDFHTTCQDLTVENCEAWNCQGAFFIHNRDINVTIKNSVAHDADAGYNIQNACEYNRIENCTAYNCGDGFITDASSNNEIINCTAYNCRYGGYFRAYDWSWTITGYHDALHCYNNVFSGCSFSGNNENYRFQEQNYNYWGTNYIYNAVESPVTISRNDDSSENPNLLYKYENGRVFNVNGEWIPCYPDGSYKQWTPTDGITTITAYDLYAVPGIGQVDVVVSKFDTSLPQGQTLVDFTADTTNGNNVVFTVSGLKAGHNYLAKKDGADFVTKQADASGKIQFSNSEWSIRKFTIEEIFGTTGTISGTVINTTGASIQGATVTADSYSGATNSTGGYTIALPVGNYTVTASKTGYQSQTQENVEVLEGQTTEVNFILTELVPPTITSFSPADTTPEQDDGTTNIFNVTADQVVSNAWYFDTNLQSETSHSFTKTWSYTDAGLHNITYMGSNANGTASLTWMTTVKDVVNETPPTIFIQSPANKTYTTKIIPLNFTADELLDTCLLSVDSTINQTLRNCQNLSVISKEYQPISGTVAWWHFNGDAADSSGNNNHGIVNGASWTTGKFGSALNFNGANDWVSLSDSNSFDTINKTITIEAWVKPILTGNRNAIIYKYRYSGVNERCFGFEIAEGGNVSFVLCEDGTYASCQWIDSEGIVENNTWSHVAGTSDGTTMRIYINGKQDSNTYPAPPKIYTNNYCASIGIWQYGESSFDNPFNGEIDELRILNRCLSEEEIKSDYAQGEGSHSVTVYGNDTAGNWNSSMVYFGIQMEEEIPPASITNLRNTTGTTWINWTWDNPSDGDFNHTMVYLDGVLKINTSNTYYNATGLNPDTSYGIGTHTVDTNGNVNSTWVNQTAKTLALNSAPVADPNGPYTGTEGVSITFDGSDSYDPNGSIVSYAWDFSDGNTGTGVSLTHIYAQNGTYTVTLTVTDNNGATDTNTTTATIADTEPTAEFTATPTSGPEPLIVAFIDISTSYDGITAWEWDFNSDGVIDNTTQNPIYTYTEAGTYTVTLKVYEADGGSDTETKADYITVIKVNNAPYKPHNPYPSDGAINISINTDLSWSGGDPDADDTVTYDVYFGTNTTPPLPLASENQTETTYDPDTLNYSTLYYWWIVATDNHGASNESEIWNFTTAAASDSPPLVTNPAATPATILNDPGRPRASGTNISQLNVTVTDDTGVDTVTIDLSLIGGSTETQMSKIPGTDIWTVTVKATAGINLTHNLVVNATDISGNFNNTVSISLTVLRRSDVFRDNIIDMKDAIYITRYLAGLEPERSNPPSVLVGDIVGSGGDPTGDGIVNMKDVLYIARYKAGWEDEP